jgi:hypothetical protein
LPATRLIGSFRRASSARQAAGDKFACRDALGSAGTESGW